MSFKKSKLATCIALAAMVPATIAVAQSTDALSSYSAQAKKGQLVTFNVYLADVGSLTKATVNNKQKFAANLKQVEAKQAAVLADITALDGNINVLPGAKIFGNFVRVQADASYANKIKNIAGVKAVVTETTTAVIPANALAKPVVSSTSSTKAPALVDDATAGEGVKVAIIGTGVDYTHVGLGGDGQAETYGEAMVNALNAYDGFPTDVVVEGMDLSSDAGWGLDPNPIDQNIYFTREHDGATHNTGHGTRLASVVHSLAPGAKISAFKTSNVSDPYGNGYQLSPESSSTFMLALEYALDPNQDGSFDDRADIIVVDAFGGNAFYAPSDTGISGLVAEAHAIEMASGLGALVVVNAGIGGEWFDNRFNITWRGAAPSALTVGGMSADADGNMMVTESTPHGPVRGANGYSKPDMVSYAENIDVAVVGGGTQTDVESTTVMAAARTAAAAAIIKSKRPELSMVEIKALLMNTANNNVMDLEDKQADLVLIGNGVEDLEAALSSSVVAWEKNSYQPNLSFGFEEGMGVQRFVKEVQLKNLSEETVTYEVAVNAMAKSGNGSLTWDVPASVSVPAGQTVIFPVVLEIDFSKLENWPFKMASDFNSKNWSEIELSGQLQLTAEEKPTVSMSWLVKPRVGTSISRDFSTFEEQFSSEMSIQFSPEAGSYVQQFSNSSPTETTIAVFPAMYHQKQLPEGKENTQGNMPNVVGGGIYDEAMCSTGKKLVVAGRFFKPNDAGMANHFDKAGAALIWWNVYQEQFVLDNGFDQAVNGEPFAWDEANQVVMGGFIEPDENGAPASWYIDYNQEYDWMQPRKRYTKSKLPTYMTGHGQNFVSQYCLEDLYHGDNMASIEDFDQNHGWIFATDRDAVADLGEPIIQYNPVKYGKVEKQSYFDWFSGEMKEIESNGGGLPLMSRLVEEGESKTYSPMMTLAAGETVELGMASECNFTFGFGGDGCTNHGMMLISLEDNWGMTSPMGQGSYSFIAHPLDGQSHSVDEDAEMGDLVGAVLLDSESFFAAANFDAEWTPYSLSLANAIPGDPFAINDQGEIIVNNPAAIDYDLGNTSFNLEVIGRHGNTYTAVSNVQVMVNNVNDIAPELVAEMPAVSMGETDTVEIDASMYFSEAEGDALTYSATGLPEGVSIDSVSGMISGSAAAGAAGEYEVVVTADDAVNKTEASFVMTLNAPVAKEPVSVDNGGSLGVGLLSLFALLGLRRKVRR
ncbi:Peptidase S8 and S53, subtilisin, kexin, sedolisin:Cadherin [Shewanella piezotolerans WP3]|uniref:Peptidase S8 and S53, subtilisin, kexin, sedolisin:Cadherin n=1 Tax=Shewanella piezotolerans (strain WP3 / JCM 13877) TaxID=225849 RepID=B8CLV2_SHEPW|nr:S8 family serine peptidase [Shewanella piezotolerans]ACJ28876.1 Peptidase S8 and S53, subtilisin, kexin, sedolisin:Cadherin [Shewanella piezotolerans WP3]